MRTEQIALLLLCVARHSALRVTRRTIARGAAVAWTPICIANVAKTLASGGPESPHGVAKREMIADTIAGPGRSVLEVGIGANRNALLYPPSMRLVGLDWRSYVAYE